MKTSQNPSQWQVIIILCIGVLSISTAAIFIRLAIETVQIRGVGFSLFIAASRLTLASLVLIPTIPFSKQKTIPKKEFYYATAAGICLALHFATWITSLSFTSIAASTTLVTTNPIWVALFSWFWYQVKPHKLTIIGIGIALLGSMIIVGGDTGETEVSTNPLLGNFLALIGAWMASLYLILARQAQNESLSTQSYVTIVYSTAAVILLPLPLLFGTSYFGYPGDVYLYILLMAILSQVVGHTSLNWAVRWLSPTLVTLAILLEPIGSSLMGFIVFGEIPHNLVLLGAGVVLMGVALAIFGVTEAGQKNYP
ncbi:MAG: DMT family transporter [Spirulinaceae cyanobacterium]